MATSSIPILVKNDPWLEPFTGEINDRIKRFKDRKKELEKKYGSLDDFAKGYEYMGLNYDKKKKGWWYREWAPAAESLHLIADMISKRTIIRMLLDCHHLYGVVSLLFDFGK
jgi:1,4-alpha-glucan branching enzyme